MSGKLSKTEQKPILQNLSNLRYEIIYLHSFCGINRKH